MAKKKADRVPGKGKRIMGLKRKGNGVPEKVRRFIVVAGHVLYRASVSVKEYGERSGLGLVVLIGKIGRRFTMGFPVR